MPPVTLVALVTLLFPTGHALAQDPPEWVIPPSQSSAISQALGMGADVGGCTANEVSIDHAVVRATFHCASGDVSLELVHPDAAPAGARAAGSFAIVAPTADPTFLDALAERVAREGASVQWAHPQDTVDVGEDAIAAQTPPPPTEPWAIEYHRALELYRNERYEESLRAYVELARTHPGDGVLAMIVAALASTTPNLARVRSLQAAADAAPTDLLAQWMAGVAAHYHAHQTVRGRDAKRPFYEETIRYLERTRPTYDFEPRLFIYLGVSHFRLGHQAQAEALIERAVALGAEDPDAYYCRAEIFQRTNLERSIQDLEAYLAMTARMRAQGAVLSEEKEQRVRDMLRHLGAVQRGEANAEEIFDPDASEEIVPPSDPRAYGLGILAVAVVALALRLVIPRLVRRRAG